MTHIVCYAGGTAGDLITALIDPTAATFRNGAVIHTKQRQRLKKPHLFADNAEKDVYIETISKEFNSIPSHDFAYHRMREHLIISVTVEDMGVALWAAKRFKELHRPHVWDEMMKVCNAKSVEDYAQILIDFSNMIKLYTKQTIKLEGITNGNLLTDIEQVLGRDLGSTSKEFYQTWYALQKNL